MDSVSHNSDQHSSFHSAHLSAIYDYCILHLSKSLSIYIPDALSMTSLYIAPEERDRSIAVLRDIVLKDLIDTLSSLPFQRYNSVLYNIVFYSIA